MGIFQRKLFCGSVRIWCTWEEVTGSAGAGTSACSPLGYWLVVTSVLPLSAPVKFGSPVNAQLRAAFFPLICILAAAVLCVSHAVGVLPGLGLERSRASRG